MRKWNFKRRVKQYTRKRKEFVPYAQIKQVVVLFESKGEKEDKAYHDIIQQLKADGKQVQAFAFMEKSKNMMYSREGITILDKKQLTLLHLPEEQILQQLKNTTCDVIFDFTTHTILPLQYMLLYIDAKCRVGIQAEKLLQPDFMIGTEANLHNDMSVITPNLNFLFNQILFYLKTISTSL